MLGELIWLLFWVYVGLVRWVLYFLFMLWFDFCVEFILGVFVVFVLFSLFLFVSVSLCGFVILMFLRDIVCVGFGVDRFCCGCVCVVCFILVRALRNTLLFMHMFLF